MDSGDEDEISLGGREWESMKNRLTKEGFREGASKGKTLALQASFDKGFEFGCKYGSKFGKLIGLIEATIELEPKSKDILQPFLEELHEYVDLIMKTTYPTDEKIKLELENTFNEKYCEFITQLKNAYPEGGFDVQNILTSVNINHD